VTNYYRAWWRWPRYPPDFQHLNCNQIYYVGYSLCSWRYHRQQDWHKMGARYWGLLISYPWFVILLQLKVWEPVVSYLRWLSYWHRHWYMVCCRIRNNHVTCTIWISWQVPGSLDCGAQPRTTCGRGNQVSIRVLGIKVDGLTPRSLSKNHVKGAVDGVSPDTYIAFLIIECMALPFAFLISPLERVVRSDGTRILVSEKLPSKTEFKLIKVTMTSKLILLSAFWAIWSFFYSGTWSTYLGIYFSVRARALSSLISPFFCIIGCFGLGFILDLKGVSQRRRAQYGLFTVVVTNLGVYIWSIVMQTHFQNNPTKVDWDDSAYAQSFLPYFFIQTTGPLSQSYMYWLLSSFATDAQG
jgi:hypothetical protein